MASRNETGRRKHALAKWLRDAVHDGRLAPGEMAPTARDLSARFGLSIRIVALEVQKLVGEGLLHTVPRKGTYVSRLPRPGTDAYLLAVGYAPPAHVDLIRIGFEERIAQLGATTLVLPLDQAVALRERDELPPLAGVYDHSEGRPDGAAWGAGGDLPRACFAMWNEAPQSSDVLAFDDVGGGRQAAQALIAQGHRRIAYLAAHPEPNPEGWFPWSVEREQGCRAALAAAGLGDGFAVHPPTVLGKEPEEQVASARAAAAGARAALAQASAVVAANDCAAIGLHQALQEAGVPPGRRPAVVGFDGRPAAQHFVWTSLRLPWEEVGRAAADFLWERRQRRWRGGPRVRRVPMRLIHRAAGAAALLPAGG